MKRWTLFIRAFVVVGAIAALSLLAVDLFTQTRISGDTASHLLLAVSPLLKMGSPYKDIWEIKPPVWPLVLYLWSSLFGFGILSIRIINILIAALLIFVTWQVYKRIFQTPVLEIIFLCSIVIVISPLLNSIILPTELLGLLFSMSGLLVLMGFRNDFSKYYFSGLLFFAASQTKEPFTFTVFAILPVLFESLLRNGPLRLIKNIGQILAGVITGFAGIYIYLASFGSVAAYIEVFQYKQVLFPLKLEILSQNVLPGFFAAERSFIDFPFAFSILILSSVLSFFLVNKYKKNLSFNTHYSKLTLNSIVVADQGKIKKYAALFYAVGSFFGFGLGGSYGSHYLIQVVIPFYILGGVFISYLFNGATFLFNKSRALFYLAVFLTGLSLFMLLPKRPYFSVFLHEKLNFNLTDNVHKGEIRVKELTTADQCVLSVYGWGTGENYLYSERKPCTRFFLANIVSLDWQKREYAKSVIENPPAVISYQPIGADMDVQRFETEVINIGKIVKNCYVQDTEEKFLYVPKTQSIQSLRDCIKTNEK